MSACTLHPQCACTCILSVHAHATLVHACTWHPQCACTCILSVHAHATPVRACTCILTVCMHMHPHCVHAHAPRPQRGHPRKRARISSQGDPERLNTQQHFLAKRQPQECVVCSSPSVGERHRSVFYCKTCPSHPSLCPVNCFELYHTKENYHVTY